MLTEELKPTDTQILLCLLVLDTDEELTVPDIPDTLDAPLTLDTEDTHLTELGDTTNALYEKTRSTRL